MPLTLFTNATFWPGQVKGKTFDAMLVDGPKIVAIGDDALASAHDKRIDLDGAFVSPSFGDGHCHPIFGGRQHFGPQITDALSVEATLAEIKRFAKANPDLPWIIGGTYDPAMKPDGNFDARWLDEVCPDRPVVLNAMDYHTIWVNSAAMKAAGVDANTPDLEIGTIVRREDGSPMGTMREWDAVNLIMDHAPKPSLQREIEAIKYSCERYAKTGITWWQDAWVDPGMAEAYLAAEESGVLTQGVNLAFRADPRTWEKDMSYFIEMRKKIESSPKNKNLTAVTIKYFADGVIEGGTAAMLEPYSDDPCSHGMPVWQWPELSRAVAAFDKAGFQTHIHAIGDAGIRAALDAIEGAQKANAAWDRRPTIVHVQLLDPSDLHRFRNLGVIAVFSPLWCRQDPMQAISSAPRLGEERTARQYQLRSLIDDGVRVAFGSDWPVTSEIVLEGLPVSVHRQTPERSPAGGWIPTEAITMPEAFAAYTSEVAYQAFGEKTWGALAPGFNADFVVLPMNPFEINPHAVSEMKVLRTYRNGEIIHEA
jgi:predicted amidohydrolase YtcJ